MRTNKIITLALFATLPFFAACAGMETAGIANGLDRKNLSYQKAKTAIENGANVKEIFAGECFLKQAYEQDRRDLVELFVENGADPWEIEIRRKKTFSLFDEAIRKRDVRYVKLCLKYFAANPMIAESKVNRAVKELTRSRGAKEHLILEQISEAGIAKEAISAWKEQQERERKAAEEARIAREKAEAEEQEHQRERDKKEIVSEDFNVTLDHLDDIFKTYGQLSTTERSRGNAILEAFGNEHLPFFMEKYRAARTKTLEVEQNFNELLEALKADGIDPNTDETALVLYKNKCELQAIYWTIFYKIVDQYSQFKIGVLTTDDLVKIDEELCEIY